MDNFSVKEQIGFYKKKWLKDHIAIVIFVCACVIGTLLAGVIYKQIQLIIASAFMLVLALVWVKNRIVVYVDNNMRDKINPDLNR